MHMEALFRVTLLGPYASSSADIQGSPRVCSFQGRKEQLVVECQQEHVMAVVESRLATADARKTFLAEIDSRNVVQGAGLLIVRSPIFSFP